MNNSRLTLLFDLVLMTYLSKLIPTSPLKQQQLETVLPSQRVDSHYEAISGDVHVHRPGTVILVRLFM